MINNNFPQELVDHIFFLTNLTTCLKFKELICSIVLKKLICKKIILGINYDYFCENKEEAIKKLYSYPYSVKKGLYPFTKTSHHIFNNKEENSFYIILDKEEIIKNFYISGKNIKRIDIKVGGLTIHDIRFYNTLDNLMIRNSFYFNHFFQTKLVFYADSIESVISDYLYIKPHDKTYYMFLHRKMIMNVLRIIT